MKLSIDSILDHAVRTFRRFPGTMLCAVTGACAAVAIIDAANAHGVFWWYRLLFLAIFGLPLWTIHGLVAERRAGSRLVAPLGAGAAVLLMGIYGASLPVNIPAAPMLHANRLALLCAGMCLFIPVVPHLRRGSSDDFWRFGRTLVARLALTGFFTAVLYAGLAIALAALDNLFGITILPKRYGELAVLLLGLFAPPFFLAGVPRDAGRSDDRDDLTVCDADGADVDPDDRAPGDGVAMPRGLRVFTRYIVLPIALIYLVILYAYMAKVLVAWDWPRGWVTGLVLGYAAVVTALQLLMHPIARDADATRARRMLRLLHASLLPLAVVLFLALWYRIREYGITEDRYLALALGVWCAAMAVYHLARRGPGLKAIPLTLGILAIIAGVGPWSAFSVAGRCQTERLESLLARNGMLVAGRARKAPQPPSVRDARDISATLWYLRAMHGYDAIQPWFDAPLYGTPSGGADAAIEPVAVAALLGFDYVDNWRAAGDTRMDFIAASDAMLTVTGYDRALAAQGFSRSTRVRDYPAAGVTLRASDDLGSLLVQHKTPQGLDTAFVDMRALTMRLVDRYGRRGILTIPPDSMTVDARGRAFAVRIAARTLDARRSGEQWEPEFYTVSVLMAGK